MNFIDKAISRLAISKSIAELSAKVDRLSEQVETNRTLAETAFARVSRNFNPASALGFLGDGSNRVYRGFVGDERPLSGQPAPVPLGTTLCQQLHFSLDQYRFWARAMKDRPKFLRKQWEFFYIAQALYERGLLSAGRRGIGFGVGREPLPALFASFGAEIVATDQSLDGAVRAGWIRSNEHSADLSGLNDLGICTDRMFRELVTFAEADMNAINPEFNGQFDFCWSACSLEHLGSLDHGLNFIKNSMLALKPGGVAVHTTEYNLTSNEATIEHTDFCLYRRRDIERLLEDLTAQGHAPAAPEFTTGEGYAETVVDLPPYGRGEPHLRLRVAEFDCTSIGIIVQKGG
jgi:SAM-dependent methyltransferase